MLKDLAYEDAKTLVKLAFKKHRDYINGLSYSDYQEFKKRQRNRMINSSNIMHRDSFGTVRKWIDQKTGSVMEHQCEMLSICCGAEPNEYVEEFCNACNEHSEFECNTCQEGES